MGVILLQDGTPLLLQSGIVLLDQAGVTAPSPYPAGELGHKAELLLGGEWTDVTLWALPDGGSDVTISSGTSDISQDPSPAQETTSWDNPDGRWTWRNAAGPYSGELGLSTLGRISVPALGGTRLRVEPDGAAGSCSTPGGGALEVTTAFDVRIDVDLTGFTYPSLTAVVASKASAAAGGHISWQFLIQADGRPALVLGHTVMSVYSTVTAVGQLPVPPGRICLRADFVGADLVTFSTAPAGSDLSSSMVWTSLGDVIELPGTVTPDTDASWPLAVAPGMAGCVYGMMLLGPSFTAVASPDFTALDPGTAPLSDAQGNTWTLNGSAEITDRDFRLHGQLGSSAPTTATSGGAAKAAVTLAGPLRRLQKGPAPPAGSPLRRAIGALSGDLAPLVYWPMEDTAGAAAFSSAITGVPAMTWIGTPQLAADGGFPGSDPVAVLGDAQLLGRVPAVASPDAAVFRFLWTAGTAPGSGFTVVCRLALAGKITSVSLRYDSTGNPYLVGSGPGPTGFSTVTATSPLGASWAGQRWLVSVELQPSGSTQLLAQARFIHASGATAQTDSVVASGAPGSIRAVRYSPGRDLADTAIGHAHAQTAWSEIGTLADALAAYENERAGRRFGRVAFEENVPCRIYGAPDLSVPMGPQQSDTVMGILDACQKTDQGIIYEPKETYAIGYRTSHSMLSQPYRAVFSLSGHDLPSAPAGSDDDATLVNDWTISDAAGNSGRAVLDDGSPTSVGIAGRRPNTDAALPARPSALPDIAGWRLRQSAADETRFDGVTVDFALLSPDQQAAAAALRPGDRVLVTDVPPTVAGGDVDQLVIGATETLGPGRVIDWNGVPGRPWDAFTIGDDETGRWDSGTSAVSADVDETTASITVQAPLRGCTWTTDTADCPFDVDIDGEQVRVSIVSGTGSTQTFSCTRSVNGVVKPHKAGAPVRLWRTSAWALS